jgi:hypothetical protein
MSNSTTATGRQPWRMLVWDASDADDARWLLATVTAVQPAGLDRRHPGSGVLAWLGRVTGLDDPALTALPGALAWRVDAD